MTQVHVSVFARDIIGRQSYAYRHDVGHYSIQLASGREVVVTLHLDSAADIERLRDWLDSIEFHAAPQRSAS